jgi:iron(III) transport system substrate-binding protein
MTGSQAKPGNEGRCMSMRRALIVCVFLVGCGKSAPDRVVVYCALDREFADPILKDFTRDTGLEVVPRWDTEANKSVGLYEDLVREKDRPRCDVHWNNEILATIRLQRQGLLEPYRSPSALPFPAPFKAKDDTWTAFAARARVLVVNTKLLPKKEDWPATLMDCTDPKWKAKFAMARPQFGTTATQAACLFQMMGSDQAKDFFHKVRENDAVLLPGNKQVAEAVSQGRVFFGVTDTDDAFAEVDAGQPVTIIFPDALPDQNEKGDLPRSATLFIPNTVALIKGCPNPAGGKKLIDYLLKPEVEAKLAKAQSRQIPLNPLVKVEGINLALPDWDRYGSIVDFAKIVDCWDEAQRFLAMEFAAR